MGIDLKRVMSSRGCMVGWALLPSLLIASSAGASDLQLVDAVRYQRPAEAAELISQRVDVNVAQPDGTTALQWAAYHDDLETAELLLRAGAEPDSANDYGMTPVMLAARNGSGAMLETLLEGGADSNLPLPTGQTPLMTAAMTGKLDAVSVLLSGGADTNAKESTHGQTALMWAVSEEHVDTVRALLARGADARATSDSGFTPLMFAARGGDLELVRLLLASGSNVNHTSEDGTSVLHVATVRGHAKLALYLLELGADPNADGPGYTPLHWASGTWESSMTFDYYVKAGEWGRLGGIQEGRLDLISALLANGADPNARVTGRPPRFGGAYGTPPVASGTPFFLAAQAHDTDVMRLLIAAGADPTLKANGDTTPLMAAAMMGRQTGASHLPEAGGIRAVELCLMLGNDVNAANENGDTALHAITHYGWAEMGEFLLQHGADPSPVNAKGQTPLRNALGVVSSAMLREQPEVAAVLTRYGAIAPEVALECGVCPESGLAQPPEPDDDHPEDDHPEDADAEADRQ